MELERWRGRRLIGLGRAPSWAMRRSLLSLNCRRRWRIGARRWWNISFASQLKMDASLECWRLGWGARSRRELIGLLFLKNWSAWIISSILRFGISFFRIVSMHWSLPELFKIDIFLLWGFWRDVVFLVLVGNVYWMLVECEAWLNVYCEVRVVHNFQFVWMIAHVNSIWLRRAYTLWWWISLVNLIV